MSIVALDLATETGVAVWPRDGRSPLFTTIRLGGAPGEVGFPLEKLRQYLAMAHDADPITHLFFEAAILPGRTSIQTVFKLCALAGMAEWFAFRVGAACRMVDQQSWRKHFTGRGTGKSAELKALAIATAKSRGWDVKTDHEADALGVLDYGIHCLGMTPPWRDNHLFGVCQ